MKSCSIINAVFFACKMKRFMTLLAMIRCSESRKLTNADNQYIYATSVDWGRTHELGSSMRKSDTFGFPRARQMATR